MNEGQELNERGLGARIKRLNHHHLAIAIAVAMALFHLYTGFFGVFPSLEQRSIHLLFVLVLVFLLFPAKKGAHDRGLPFYDWILVGLTLVSLGYMLVNSAYVLQQRTEYLTPLLPIERFGSALLTLLVIEACRRTVGLFLTVTVALFVAYVFLCPYLPGVLWYPGVRLDLFFEVQYLTQAGLFGIPLGMSATFIVLFIIFGAIMMKAGMGELITDIAGAVAGRTRGGPAKIAILSSAMFGTISGSSSANVAITGNFTIPLMKRMGFEPHYAGAVEATASTGGQLMPPVMGAAAFIMASYSGVPYSTICVMAIIPAVLYFACIFFQVDFQAAKKGLEGLPKEMLPSARKALLNFGHLIIPVVVLLYLFMSGRTLFFAITWSIVSVVIVSFLRKRTRFTPRSFSEALAAGAKGTVIVAVACAAAGIVIGSIYVTGIGARFTALIIDISSGSLLFALVMTMIAAMILGMGMPTAAAYIMQVALIIPALVKMGLLPIIAHFYAFYWACLSLITPPIATASYVAAGIAGSPMTKTSVQAVKLCAVLFVIPYMFVYSPALLAIGTPFEIATAFVTALIGTYAFAVGIEGYLFGRIRVIERIPALIGGLLLIYSSTVTDIIGIVILALLYLWNRYDTRRKLRTATAT